MRTPAQANDRPLIRASRTFSRREKDLDEAGSRFPGSLFAEIPLPRERVAEGRVRGESSTRQRRPAPFTRLGGDIISDASSFIGAGDGRRLGWPS